MSWQLNIIRRIQEICEYGQPLIATLDNGEPVFACYLPVMVKIEQVDSEKPNVPKYAIKVDLEGLSVKDNLVGMGGMYYSPRDMGTTDTKNVVESWNWFVKQTNIDEGDFIRALETQFVWYFFRYGYDEGLTFYILSLVVDLPELDLLGVDVKRKLSEIGKKIREHVSKYEKLSRTIDFQTVKGVANATVRIKELRQYLANLSSETKLARVAKFHGFDVKLGFHPDLTINGKSIEVKRLAGRPIIPDGNLPLFTIVSPNLAEVPSMTNPVREGLRQEADLVAIEVPHLEKVPIKGFNSTWLATEGMATVLRRVLEYNARALAKRVLGAGEGIWTLAALRHGILSPARLAPQEFDLALPPPPDKATSFPY